MSEHQFKGAYSLGYGDGRHEALKGVAKSHLYWFVDGIALGLLMGAAMYLASKGSM